MKPKCEDPAVCDICHVSFEDAGKYRYRNLKRHKDNMHSSNNSLSNSGLLLSAGRDNNLNINLHINSISSSDYTKLLEGLRGIISDCISSRKNMMPEMLNVLHSTNGNIVVPNKNKDEVLIKTGKQSETIPLSDGVKLCVDAFINDGITKIHTELDKTDSNSESEKCRERLGKESTFPVTIAEEFGKKLKRVSNAERKRIAKILNGDDY